MRVNILFYMIFHIINVTHTKVFITSLPKKIRNYSSIQLRMDNNDLRTIDFGVNLDILDNSYDLYVDKVVCISNNYKEAQRNLILAEKFSCLYFTLGIHPHNAKDFQPRYLKFIQDNINHPKCFGIGECGLDFNRNFSLPETQKGVFREQIRLAK